MEEVGLGFRFADLVDIVLVAALVYTAFAWIRRTRALLVAVGMFLIGVLYIAARALDLRLTAWIFQGFFAIFVVAIVVIFQEELRQIFERIAVWGLRRRPARQAAGQVDALVSCMADFARARIGALVVLPGMQPVERHLTGGVELKGRLSAALLKSIFDPHSPGHDGAVVVEGGDVARFAVHLPLSKDLQQLSGAGTRHSAALGLAELTDALCLVVSEERGTISVARDGRLREVKDPPELGLILEQFMREKRPKERPVRAWRQLVLENWIEKLGALGLVACLWYLFVPGSRVAEVTYHVPVKVVNLPPDLALERVDPPEVKATFQGLRRDFYLFDEKRLQITVDGSLTKMGRRTFKISDRSLRYPKDLSLRDLSPSRVKISVKKSDRAQRGEGSAAEEGQAVGSSPGARAGGG